MIRWRGIATCRVVSDHESLVPFARVGTLTGILSDSCGWCIARQTHDARSGQRLLKSFLIVIQPPWRAPQGNCGQCARLN